MKKRSKKGEWTTEEIGKAALAAGILIVLVLMAYFTLTKSGGEMWAGFLDKIKGPFG
jgi:hypothetical protein